MLTQDDRRAIEGLFDRLRTVETQASPPDREADEMIRRAIERQPNAPYYMAQTIVVQEQALEQAQRRIEELENSTRRQASRDLEGHANSAQPRGPWNRNSQYEEQREGRWGGGGGFLAGAMQTALGVTSGILLGSALGGLFGAGGANANEAEQTDSDNQNDQNDQNDQESDAGDDAGGDSDFDVGGDF